MLLIKWPYSISTIKHLVKRLTMILYLRLISHSLHLMKAVQAYSSVRRKRPMKIIWSSWSMKPNSSSRWARANQQTAKNSIQWDHSSILLMQVNHPHSSDKEALIRASEHPLTMKHLELVMISHLQCLINITLPTTSPQLLT